ncbi:unnamed protein product [Nippostrongylus brasiliensis]|uniref:CCHC-type domain-containing protein n=1 Tax=Nippostrongylus brasiliensis TaxID=27835 RepID=A0A0N4YDI1_NIPBR|nr:unnamed protein product [Nippostrongylus brasiliensis]
MQLRTLFSLPTLLIALKEMSPSFWSSLMEQPLRHEDKPVLTRLEDIENVITDHLQTLSDLRSTLRDIRVKLQIEQEEETTMFEEEMRQKLSHIEDLLKDQNLRTEGEMIPEKDNEKKIILDNAEYLEGALSEDPIEESAEETEQEQDTEEEETQRRSPSVEQRRSPSEAQRRSPPVEQRRAPPEAQRRNPPPEVHGAARIELEIRCLQQALRDFDAILQQLQEESVCPPRRFHRGRFLREEERYMKCAFCGEMGTHYSDSCIFVRYAVDRRRMIDESAKCAMCLEYSCQRQEFCSKYRARCFHCREFGHHSALCEFPERSDATRARITEVRNRRHNCATRMDELRRELARL